MTETDKAVETALTAYRAAEGKHFKQYPASAISMATALAAAYPELVAEIERLTAVAAEADRRLALSCLEGRGDVDMNGCEFVCGRAYEAEAEVTRLREALTEIAEGEWYYAGSTIQGGPDPTRKVPGRWATIARAALNPAG